MTIQRLACYICDLSRSKLYESMTTEFSTKSGQVASGCQELDWEWIVLLLFVTSAFSRLVVYTMRSSSYLVIGRALFSGISAQIYHFCLPDGFLSVSKQTLGNESYRHPRRNLQM